MKKIPLTVVLMVIPMMVLVAFLLLKQNISYVHLLSGIYICALFEIPLIFVHFRNRRISRLQTQTVFAKIVKRTFIDDLEYVSENLYTHNNKPALCFRFKDAEKTVEVTFWVPDKVYSNSFENQTGILTYKKDKEYFFVSFNPDGQSGDGSVSQSGDGSVIDFNGKVASKTLDKLFRFFSIILFEFALLSGEIFIFIYPFF